MIVTSILFIVVLSLLFLTFSSNSISNNSTINNSSPISGEKIKTTNKFSDDVIVIQSSFSKSESSSSQQDLINQIQRSQTSSKSIPQEKNGFSDDIINKDLKLPEPLKIQYNFDSQDKIIIGKYLKTNYENKIVSILKDDKNLEIIAFKIPEDKIDKQTIKDFPKTFKFSNEDRKAIVKDKIFLYYSKEKRIAYLGDYISSVDHFEYESQDYWLILYGNEILISKPNFSNWKTIDLKNEPILDFYKKSNFEFEILKSVSYENYDEYKIEVISPQKYIIEGIFDTTQSAE